MRIALISDTHGRHNQIDVPECDICICAGDISVRGYKHEIQEFAQWYKQVPAKRKVFIAGNHDFYCQEQPSGAKRIFDNFNLDYLYNSSVEIQGLRIWGSPWTPWFHDWAFNLPQVEAKIHPPSRAPETQHLWEQIPDDTDIVVTHGPPHGILDTVARTVRGEHPQVGCPFLRKRLEEVQPLLHVFGHIHEHYGTRTINRTTYVNAASCDLRYQPIHPVVLVEITNGNLRLVPVE